MRVRRHVEATPEAIAAAEVRMSKRYRERRHRDPEPNPRDPYAAADVPDYVSVMVTRSRHAFTGSVTWGWWARSYQVDVLASDGTVHHTKRTMHQGRKDVTRPFAVRLTARPDTAGLVRDLSRSVWALGGAAPVVAVAPYWQPPLPGL